MQLPTFRVQAHDLQHRAFMAPFEISLMLRVITKTQLYCGVLSEHMLQPTPLRMCRLF